MMCGITSFSGGGGGESGEMGWGLMGRGRVKNMGPANEGTISAPRFKMGVEGGALVNVAMVECATGVVPSFDLECCADGFG